MCDAKRRRWRHKRQQNTATEAMVSVGAPWQSPEFPVRFDLDGWKECHCSETNGRFLRMLDGFRSDDELITFSNANYVCSVVRSKQQSIIWITLRKQASLCIRPMAVGIIPKGVLVVKKKAQKRTRRKLPEPIFRLNLPSIPAPGK